MGENIMELAQLESFLRVAEEGSMTRAAEALYRTQPAVTQQVRALERELKVLLFERTGRGVRLTQAGEALQDYARRSLGLLAECRQVLADLEGGAAGRLVLGAGVTTSIFHLPPWLRAFREICPAVDVVVRTGRSREVEALALAREIDLGLVTSPVRHPELAARELFQEAILLVAPPGHPLAGQSVPPAALVDAPLILFPRGTGFRADLDRALAGWGAAALIKMESDSVEAIKSFVAVGLGLSFLPASAVEEELAAGTLRPVTLTGVPPLQRATTLIYRPDRYLPSAAREFLRLLD
jgi:DNA-binding transcriptional LysR family regulator